MKYALIGFPIIHSISPFIHAELFSLNGLEYSYEKLEISNDALNVSDIMQDYNGINVTIPYKTDVISQIDELCSNAVVLKTVNTIKKDNGKLYGYNTDIDGFLKSLEISGISLSGNVLICGAGGTSRMMCYAAAMAGCDITINCRRHSKTKADLLATEVKACYPCKIEVSCEHNVPGEFDLLLNGTPAGMYPVNQGLYPIGRDTILHSQAVFDAVYNPRNTALIKYAESNGKKIAYGMPMLVFQAAKAQEIWLGVDFNNDDLLQLIEKANKQVDMTYGI